MEASPSRLLKRRILLILRLAIGAMFVVAGAMKLWDLPHFIAVVAKFKMLPGPMVSSTGIYLPWLEIVSGVAVILYSRRRGVLLVPTLLVIVFLAAIISAWARGLEISCDCFGSGIEYAPGIWHVLSDVAILSILLVLAIALPTPLALHSGRGQAKGEARSAGEGSSSRLDDIRKKRTLTPPSP